MNKKKHVVIIMADQLRYDVLGEFTPNLNQLKQESVVFDRAYCASPLCTPARGAFFTGRYPNETGCLINPWDKMDLQHGKVRANTQNLYQLMENDWDCWHTGKQHLFTEDQFDTKPDSKVNWNTYESGYATFLRENGKRHPGGSSFQGIVPEMVQGTTTRVKKYSIPTISCYEEGFDYFFDGYITHTSLDAIRSRDKSKPLFLSAMFLAPHPPLDIPEPWFSKVKKVEIPDNVAKWCANQSPLQLYNITGKIGSAYTREDWEKIWLAYMGLVNLLDDCVGMVIAELKAEGIYDDTLILFTSDHGEMLGSHCLWQKMCMYEESVRTPLYMKFPLSDIPDVKHTDALVSAVDVLPTLCDYLELEVPADMSGRSLLPLLQGKELGRDRIFIQYDGNGGRGNYQRCIIEGAYKLIVDIFKDETFLELYQVTEDSQELINLAFEPQYEAVIVSMLSCLKSHMTNTNDLLQLSEELYEDFLQRYLPFKEEPR